MPILNTMWLYIHTNLVIWSYALITIAAVSATLYLVVRTVVRVLPAGGLIALWQGREGAVAVSGGASALILSGTSKREDLFDESRTGLATVLDGVTMIFMELSFITLWTGIILGALWADVSWGRPWGWDPKEVFALNTWLIFLILVHVRLKVKDKALWTAVLAVIGFGVMLFNWLAVNFVIVGLHSYA
jgi:ABC-type transport system involved in cytochrome c biogenesis permease subunit